MPILQLPSGPVALRREAEGSRMSKRFVREPGMPILQMPDGTVALRREAEGSRMSKRFVREPGMPILQMPNGTVALRRSAQEKESKGTAKPLKLTVAAGKYGPKRSMPLELSSSELSSMTKAEAEKYSRRGGI
ncbi:hypothetical protein CBS101457_000536 [Exobasidium rhododendri]|nr:hypothetical protein CBS101457_000536 [Exobasidium rhododendri]